MIYLDFFWFIMLLHVIQCQEPLKRSYPKQGESSPCTSAVIRLWRTLELCTDSVLILYWRNTHLSSLRMLYFSWVSISLQICTAKLQKMWKMLKWLVVKNWVTDSNWCSFRCELIEPCAVLGEGLGQELRAAFLDVRGEARRELNLRQKRNEAREEQKRGKKS